MPKSLRSIVRFASACSDAIRKRSFFATSRASIMTSRPRFGAKRVAIERAWFKQTFGVWVFSARGAAPPSAARSRASGPRSWARARPHRARCAGRGRSADVVNGRREPFASGRVHPYRRGFAERCSRCAGTRMQGCGACRRHHRPKPVAPAKCLSRQERGCCDSQASTSLALRSGGNTG
jgi:hypothetical protein